MKGIVLEGYVCDYFVCANWSIKGGPGSSVWGILFNVLIYEIFIYWVIAVYQ